MKQIKRIKQSTKNKIFLIRLKLTLKKASNTELQEIAILVQQEFNKRNKKGK